MLLENAISILALAIDDVPEFYNQHLGALSQQLGEVTGAENGWLDKALDRFLDSDVNNKTRRLFIPIDDAMYPIHYTGAKASKSNDSVTQKLSDMKGNSRIKATTGPAYNTVTLNFEIKSSVSNLSTIVDILHAIAKKDALHTGDVPRISFFSSTMCVLNADFLSIRRETVANSEKEMVSLEFGVEEDTLLAPVKQDAKKQDPSLANSSGCTRSKSAGKLEQAQATLADFDPVYDFYLVAIRDYLDAPPVPRFEAEQTMKRQPYQIFRVESRERSGAKKNMHEGYVNNIFSSSLACCDGALCQ